MKRHIKVSKVQRSERKPPMARKIDRQRVMVLAKKGWPTKAIALDQSVQESTIWRFLERKKPEQQALERFKLNRADEFTRLQGKAIGVQHQIIDLIQKDVADGVLNTLLPATKAQYLNVLNNVQGTIYDKERLERGESTSNVSIVSRMVDHVVGNMYKRKPLPDVTTK